MRAVVPIALLLLLPGCGAEVSSAGRSTTPSEAPAATVAEPDEADPTRVLAAVAEVARSAGTVRYGAVVEGARDGEPLAVEARLSGALDLGRDSGTADLELLPVADMAAEAAAEDPSASAELEELARVRLSWTAGEVAALIGGRTQTAPRDDTDDSVFARVPGEPGGLIAVAASARDVRSLGSEEVAGARTTRYGAVADPQAAVDAGLGTQAHLAIAQLPQLPLEVWVDDAGRPVRIRYSATVPSLIAGASRTMTVTYDYTRWGEPVDLTLS